MSTDKMFLENRKVIKPITFVNDENKETEDINAIFTLPYDIAIMSEAKVNDKLNYITQNNIVPEEVYNSFLSDVNRMSMKNYNSAIYNYLLMNVTDYLNTFLIDLFCNKMDPIGNKYFYFRSEEVYSLIRDLLDNYIITASSSIELLNAYYYQLVNNMYFAIIEFVNNIIAGNTYRYCTNNYYFDANHKDEFFEYFYVKAYGDLPKDDNKIDAATKYTFITSIAREMVEKEFPKMYEGLCKIFFTASHMGFLRFNPDSSEQLMAIMFNISEKNKTKTNHCKCNGSCNDHKEK